MTDILMFVGFADRQTDGQMDRQTDGQTDRERETDGLTMLVVKLLSRLKTEVSYFNPAILKHEKRISVHQHKMKI